MPSLGDNVRRLAAHRAQFAATGLPGAAPDRLSDVYGFGSNPGALRARSFVPPTLENAAPLVVVLHGCTQTAADYDHGAGWSALAEAEGFALLFPEQARANNGNLCFNWFAPEDVRRGEGEVESIRQMIAAMLVAHGLDRRRVFVTGLSAGGAMAMAMLATAPEVFAGGAIIAGLPYGSAANVPEAFERMRGQGLPGGARAAALVSAASAQSGSFTGPWPTLSVWQGSADTTVDPANADALVAGWARLHGLAVAGSDYERINGHCRRSWRNPRGDTVIEAYAIAGMGHGTPITARGPEACGTPAPHMLEAGISSTRRIAGFWGIAPEVADGLSMPMADAMAAATGVEGIIDRALRQAGLLR